MGFTRNTGRGLGLYPGDPCYDPDRPSWLPYWIDDFTESDCFYNAPNVIAAVPNAAGYMAGQAVGITANAVGTGIAAATSQMSWWTLGALGVGGLLLFEFLKK